MIKKKIETKNNNYRWKINSVVEIECLSDYGRGIQ